MHRIASAAFAAALAIATVTGLATAQAQDVKVGDIGIERPWARASAGPARNGAAFMVIHNAGAQDRLLSASAEISKRVELHTHLMDGDIMRMRQVEAIEVPADGMATLQPGGLHVMFMGLHAPLKEGESFPLTLTFEKAGSVTVEVAVEAAGSMGQGGMNHGGMNHGKKPASN